MVNFTFFPDAWLVNFQFQHLVLGRNWTAIRLVMASLGWS